MYRESHHAVEVYSTLYIGDATRKEQVGREIIRQARRGRMTSVPPGHLWSREKWRGGFTLSEGGGKRHRSFHKKTQGDKSGNEACLSLLTPGKS